MQVYLRVCVLEVPHCYSQAHTRIPQAKTPTGQMICDVYNGVYSAEDLCLWSVCWVAALVPGVAGERRLLKEIATETGRRGWTHETEGEALTRMQSSGLGPGSALLKITDPHSDPFQEPRSCVPSSDAQRTVYLQMTNEQRGFSGWSFRECWESVWRRASPSSPCLSMVPSLLRALDSCWSGQ